ncbi:MAG: hypothetical protein PHU25_05000 [Deltaproteobacteria bacterium]|nr:hypothetical protein [Deltaproteobacteria bacterium]
MFLARLIPIATALALLQACGGPGPSPAANIQAAGVLAARDVEDPADLAANGPAADVERGGIEVESVEVELGCVEVCVD